AFLIVATQPNHAQTIIASDNAGDAAYASGWSPGSNGGTGFQAWSFNNNNSTNSFAGNFKGASVLGTDSFGLYANPGVAFSNANRAFSTALVVGNTFSINLGVNFDNGNKGFNLYSGGTQLFNFNVGSGAGISVGDGLTLTPGLGGGYDYGGDATISLSIKYQDSDKLSYSVSRSSSQGIQGVLFQGLVTGTFAAPDNFRLYVSGTDDANAANNFYANNLLIIPEPSTPLLMGLGLAGLLALRRTRKD
ncbi:MAG: PEP-CTERM sorting domain-containing protein, partial [Flavobacteriia bacterium]|nr:PEP-CTERM sorting domain-containing protein [Flavobacteriia bacterium]